MRKKKLASPVTATVFLCCDHFSQVLTQNLKKKKKGLVSLVSVLWLSRGPTAESLPVAQDQSGTEGLPALNSLCRGPWAARPQHSRVLGPDHRQPLLWSRGRADSRRFSNVFSLNEERGEMRKLQQFLLVNYLAFLVTKWGFVGSKCGNQVPGLLTSLPFHPSQFCGSKGWETGNQQAYSFIFLIFPFAP